VEGLNHTVAKLDQSAFFLEILIGGNKIKEFFAFIDSREPFIDISVSIPSPFCRSGKEHLAPPGISSPDLARTRIV